MPNKRDINNIQTGWSTTAVAAQLVKKFAHKTGISYGLANSILIQQGANPSFA